MKNFELVVAGFNGGTAETDGHVIWVAAEGEAELKRIIADNNFTYVISFGDDLPDSYGSNDGIDFQLPAESGAFAKRVLLLLPGPNGRR